MRKWMIALMVVLCVGLAGGAVFIITTSDHEGPEITFTEDKVDIYEEGMENAQLLEDVKAKDAKDGDVSDTLTVESVYQRNNGKEVVVIYVAKDSSNNVSKAEFTMKTSGSEEADEEKKDKKKKDTEDGTDQPVSADASGEPAEDGDDSEQAGTQPEMTKEEEVKKTQEDKIAQLNPQDPRMYLTTYYLEVPRGTNIDKLSYVADIQDDVDDTNALWRGIQIDGAVDVNTPGTYELKYFVVDSNGNSSNGAVLTVVVVE